MQKAVRKDTPFRVYWVEAETICREHAEGDDFCEKDGSCNALRHSARRRNRSTGFGATSCNCSLSLTFDGTTAICEAICTGNSSTDQVKATIELYQGNTYLASWSNEETYFVAVSGQRGVTRGKSYTLKLTYTINGVAQPEQSVTKVCR